MVRTFFFRRFHFRTCRIPLFENTGTRCRRTVAFFLLTSLLISNIDATAAAIYKMNLKVENLSGYDDSKVFFTLLVNGGVAYLDFKSGTLQKITPPFKFDPDTMVASLADIKRFNTEGFNKDGSYSIHAPQMPGARVYFSFDEKFSSTSFDKDSGPSPGCTVLYDKFEVYLGGGKSPICNTNTTNVDFFAASFKITANDINFDPPPEVSIGLTDPAQTIYTAFNSLTSSPDNQKSGNTDIFKQIIVKKAGDDGQILRVLSPESAGYEHYNTAKDGQLKFSHFFDTYINEHCWKKDRTFKFHSKKYKPGQDHDTEFYYGKISSDGLTLKIYTGSEMRADQLYGTMPRPTNLWDATHSNIPSPPYFHNVGTNGGIPVKDRTDMKYIDWGFAISGQAGPESLSDFITYKMINDPVFMSIPISICRGVMHRDDGAEWTDSDNFFKGDPETGLSTEAYPVFHYAKILHDYAILNKVYAFSFDDIFGQDPSIYYPDPKTTFDTNITLTINPFSPKGDGKLTMSVNNTDAGTATPDAGVHDYEYVTKIPVTTVANPGYQFGRWNVSGNTTVDKPGSAMNATVTLTGAAGAATANFAKTVDISDISSDGKKSIPDLADSKGGMKNIFVFNATSGKNFTLTTSGGSGDCDIYVKQGMAPNITDYQFKSTKEDAAETVTVDNPAAGNWYVLLYSATDFANVKLDIDINANIPDRPVLTGSLSGTKVNLEWTPAGTSYDVYRCETEITSNATVVKPDSTILAYQENFTGTYYYYWVVAKAVDPDDSGKFLKSDFSNAVRPHGSDVITKILTNGVPATGISGAATTTTTYQINVPAGQALLEINAYGGKGDYDIDTGIDGSAKRYRSLMDQSFETIRIENPDAGSYLIHLYGKTAYSGVAVVAKYYGGIPLPATGLAAGKGVFSDRIILGWTDSKGATFYEIWRSKTAKITDASKIGNVPDNSYEDNIGLEQDIIYYYWIKAGNALGVAKEGASASGYLLKKPSAIPTGLAAGNKLRFDKITLTWPKCAGATSYIVYRATANNSTEAKILTEVESMSNQNACSYDNMGDDLATGTSYYYFIKSKNGSGTSGFSSGSMGMLRNAGPAYLTASDGTYFGKIKVSWPEIPGATGYELRRYTDRGMTENEEIFDAGNSLSYGDDSALKGTTYYYRVRAQYRKAYTSLYSPSNSGYHGDIVTVLPAPAIKSVSKGDYGYVRIVWGLIPLAENYKIYRNTVNTFATSEPLPTTENTAFEDKTAVPDTTYWYWIKANNDKAGATSVPSASMSGFAKSASVAIADGETVTTDAAKGNFKFYSLEIPAGVTRLVVSLTGTSTANNCDIYVKLASYPTLSSYNAKGIVATGGETLTVNNPAQGTWYILLYGNTAYAGVTLSAHCYSVSDIVLTEVPVDNLTPPLTVKFKGKVVDNSGKGIPGLSIQARDPITGTKSWLTLKTDAGGFWTFSSKIDREGAHEFDFFFTDLPDLAKGTATHTVFTRKDCWEAGGLFDFSSYLPGLPSPLTPEETIKMQTCLNIRQGWNDGAIDPVPEELWIEGTLGKTALDTTILGKLDDGLYLFFYAFNGTGCGNNLAASPALRPCPLIVHVSPDKKNDVLNNLNALGIIGDAQRSDILAGKTGIVAFATLSNPDEDVSGIRNMSLIAREQLEALANLAENNSSVSFVEDRKIGSVAVKVIKVKVDSNTHEFNVAADCIVQ